MATRKARPALGRGLDALISRSPIRSVSSEAEAATTPLQIPLSSLAPNPSQPRKVFDPEELSGLAASISEQGILQPLVVRKREGGYELIIGERRWRAAKLAGLEAVPAVVLDAADRLMLELALVENVQRADLNPVELAYAFRVLVEREGMTQEEVGRRVSLDRSSVANHLRLLELSSEIQQDLIDGRLTMGHAKAILQVPSELRVMVRNQILKVDLTVRAAEEFCQRIVSSGASRPRPGPGRDVHVVALEDRLRQELRTKVRIVGRPARGRIELHYFGSDELDRLSQVLLGEPA